ncbi:hypothetical protein D0437_12280 [Bacillus cereus]|uniref:Uncharacterized protein n=1 Tax=Bacillus cereus TaxID=1396 RepID=A0A9X7LVM2_BACCE|nr:zinc ribbon domain-containing protein [Bacillus cereus]QDZ73831.1 hypothetical protein D0437_12280 [Bacillus cereus]
MQSHPKCLKKNKEQDKEYKCPYMFEIHRDIVGMMNIHVPTTINGNSPST